MAAHGVRRMNHTGFTVPDLDRAASFFRGVLGFSISDSIRQTGPAVARMVGVPDAEVDIAFATLGDCTIELICYVTPRSDRINDMRHCDGGFAHIAFLVDDIASMQQALQAAGYRPFSEPQVVPAGPRKGSKNVYARGPDGIIIELQQAPPAQDNNPL
jgi:glyoxylase I family protein